jgi:hypothetical protein
MQERRRAERFPMTLPVQIGAGRGVTRDFSGLGVYFESDARFDVADEIEFVLVIPEAVDVRCVGKIVRLDIRGDRYGYAATIDSFSLNEAGEAAMSTPHIVIEQLRAHHSVRSI